MISWRCSTVRDLLSPCIWRFWGGYTTSRRAASITPPAVATTSLLVGLLEPDLSTSRNIVGKDATRAFVTGDFSPEGLVDDVTGLSEQDLLSILDWIKFYEKDYKLVGVLQGTYYDSQGKLTERGETVLG